MSEIGREMRPDPSAHSTGKTVDAGSLPTGAEKALLEILTDVARTEQATVDSNFFQDLGADSMVMARFCARIRKRSDLPTATIKDVYLHPTIRSLAAALGETVPTAPMATMPPAQKPSPRPRVAADRGSPTTGPTIGTQHALLNLLTDVVGTEQATVDSNFFQDLGADSMVMARFCARVRKRPDLPTVTIKDVYTNPTIRRLTTAVGGTLPAAAATPAPEEAPAEPTARRRAGTPMYVLCGMIQLLVFVVYLAVTEAAAQVGGNWISAAPNMVELFLRAAVYGDAAVLAMCILPIIAKWVLIGRWKAEEFPVWSLAYIRFWLVKTLTRSNPLVLVVGGRSRTTATSPVINYYLRALGENFGA
jgi:acyl carrier protein